MRNKNEHPKTYTIREILIFAVLTIIIFIVAMFIVEYFSNVIVNLFAILLPTLVDIVKEIIFGKENSKKKFKSKTNKCV